MEVFPEIVHREKYSHHKTVIDVYSLYIYNLHAIPSSSIENAALFKTSL